MQPHLLANFEIQKCYQNEPKFNIVYSRNNLPRIIEGVYVISLDEYKSIGTHCIALHVNGDNNAICFDRYSKRILKIYWKQKYNNKYL